MPPPRGHGRDPVVIVAGHVTHERGAAGDVAAAGPAFYAARVHRGLGAATRLVTAVGHDFAGDDAIAGVPAEVRRAGETTELGRGPAPRLIARAQPVLAVDLPEAWRRCDLLHLAPVLAEVDLARWAQVASARMIAISVLGWTRIPGRDGTIVTRPWAVDPRALTVVDAACVGEDELASQGDLLRRLTGAVPVVAVTRGAAGADVIVRGAVYRVGIHPGGIRDPGAGAATFAAGFFHGLARGFAPIEAAQLAAAAAAIAGEGVAGSTLPRIGEAWDRRRAVPADAGPREAALRCLS